MISGAGFAIDSINAGYVPGPKFAAYQYRGTARPT